LIILTLNTVVSSAQTNYKKSIYEAYIQGDITKWETTMKEMEKENLSVNQKLDMLNYYYGYIGYMIGKKNNKAANVYIKKGENLVDEILKENPDNAPANAYKGTFIAFKMSMSKLKSVTLGPQSMKYINKAYDLDSKNIQSITDKANLLYYAPGLFGGDKEKALEYYEKAIKAMETNNDTENWFYLNLLVTLAKYYQKAGDRTKAISMYKKILEKEPGFKWVRDELYPQQLQEKKK